MHCALFYRYSGELLCGVHAFLDADGGATEPALVIVPGERIGPLRSALGSGLHRDITFADMRELGRNPARILPAILGFAEAHGGRPVRCISEPVWAGRSPDEVAETVRHEALVNIALAGLPVRMLCAYDTALLDEEAVADAELTHPSICCGGNLLPSPAYTDPVETWRSRSRPLSVRPDTAHGVTFDASGLALLRQLVRERGARAGLPAGLVHDLLLAVTETATNAIVHGAGDCRLHVWQDGDEKLVFEITDRGCLDDPLAGSLLPEPAEAGGRGLWIVNQLCDLVQMRPDLDGTVVRLHVGLEDAALPSG